MAVWTARCASAVKVQAATFVQLPASKHGRCPANTSVTTNPHRTHTFCCVMADVLHLALHPMFLSQAKPSWLQAYGSNGQMLQLSPSPEPIVLQMHDTLATEPITVTKYTPTGPVGPHFGFLQKVRRRYQGESCLQAKARASFAWFCLYFSECTVFQAFALQMRKMLPSPSPAEPDSLPWAVAEWALRQQATG